MKKHWFFAVAAMIATNISGVNAQSLSLPDPSVPVALKPYADLERLQRAGVETLAALRAATLLPGRPCDEPNSITCEMWLPYQGGGYPKQLWSGEQSKHLWLHSPCDSEKRSLAIHRGWSWVATGYNLFTSPNYSPRRSFGGLS